MDENSGIIIEKNDNLIFNIDSNDIKINYNKTKRKGSFEIINDDKNSILDFYKNLKNIINTMSLYNPQYTNWNMKLKNYDDNELNNRVIELKPIEITKKGNHYEISTSINLDMEIKLYGSIASIKASTIIDDIKEINEKIGENCQIKNKSTVLDIYKNSFFKEKSSRFLSYVNILELLTTREHIKKNQEKCIDDLIEIIDNNYSDKLKNDEIETLKSRIGGLKRESITKSVEQIPKEQGVYIKNKKYSKNMLKKSYDVRSRLAHDGILTEDFNECYDFLDKFIPIFLRKILNIH